MDYCSTVWDGAPAYQLKRLTLMQKKCARVVLDINNNTFPYVIPTASLFSKLKWLSIPDRIKF